jgi:hypothetical protein
LIDDRTRRHVPTRIDLWIAARRRLSEDTVVPGLQHR